MRVWWIAAAVLFGAEIFTMETRRLEWGDRRRWTSESVLRPNSNMILLTNGQRRRSVESEAEGLGAPRQFAVEALTLPMRAVSRR